MNLWVCWVMKMSGTTQSAVSLPTRQRLSQCWGIQLKWMNYSYFPGMKTNWNFVCALENISWIVLVITLILLQDCLADGRLGSFTCNKRCPGGPPQKNYEAAPPSLPGCRVCSSVVHTRQFSSCYENWLNWCARVDEHSLAPVGLAESRTGEGGAP